MARVLAVSVDSMEPAILEEGVASGWLPFMEGLLRRGRTAGLRTSRALPGATWTSTVTGCRAEGHLMAGAVQLRPGSYRLATPLPEAAARPPFWKHVSDAGLTSVILNPYGGAIVRPFRGVQVMGWGSAPDPYSVYNGGARGEPPEALSALERAFGTGQEEPAEPLGSDESFRRMAERLVEWAGRKVGAATALMRERWDLALIHFSELHPYGHYAWHLQDPDHPAYGDGRDPGLRLLYRDLYAAVDAALGDLARAAGDETAIFVFTPHGMGPFIFDGDPLPPVLEATGWLRRRRGPGTQRGDLSRWLLRGAYRGIRPLVPGPVRRRMGKRLPRTRFRSAIDLADVDWRATRAFPLPWDYTSSLRLNVAGREPQGVIRPGADYDRAVDELLEELRALVDAETGESVVRSAVRVDEHLGAPVDGPLPDIAVEWENRLVRRVRTASAGTIAVPRESRRTGMHTPRGFVLGAGRGIVPAETGMLEAPEAMERDLAPTILARLGVDVPDEMTGTPIEGLG